MKLSKRQAEALGIVPLQAPGGPKAASGAKSDPEPARRAFKALCAAHGLPEPIPEYYFATQQRRLWRFDWLFSDWLALEVQGGLFSGGRHVRGAELLKEMEKLNAAAILGFAVLFCTPQQLASGEILPVVKAALEGSEVLP